MSRKPFDLFLVQQLQIWADENSKPGQRYLFRMPDNNKAVRLYDSLSSSASGTVAVNDHEHPYIQCDGVKMVVLLHGNMEHTNSVSENYVSHLRDLVVQNQGELAGCSLLLVHNSQLDTLVNNSFDLSTNGCVWHPEAIKEALASMIDAHDKDAPLSQRLLNFQFEAIKEDEGTVFGFEPLHSALEDGELEFNELGMFPDDQLCQMDDRGQADTIQIKLNKNRNLYERIEFHLTHFPNDLENRLTEFSSSFIKETFGPGDESWRAIQFDVYLTEKRQSSQQALLLKKEELIGGVLLVRSQTESRSDLRRRHMILEVDDTFELKIIFDGEDLTEEQVGITSKDKKWGSKLGKKVRNSYGKSRLSVTGELSGSTNYFTVKLSRKKSAERYTFNCIVLPRTAFYTKAIKTCYIVKAAGQCLALQTDEESLRISEDDLLGQEATLHEPNQVFDKAVVNRIDFSDMLDQEEVSFRVKSGEHELAFQIEGEAATVPLRLPLLMDEDRFDKLSDDSYNGQYHRERKRVVIDNQEVPLVATRASLIERESYMVDRELLAFSATDSIPLEELESISYSLHQAYSALFAYYRKQNTLPSLVSWGPEYRKLVSEIVDSFNTCLEMIPVHSVLTSEHKQLLGIGFVSPDGAEYLCPLHPLSLAYYNALAESIFADTQDASFGKVPEVTKQRLTARGLLPFIYGTRSDYAILNEVRELQSWLCKEF